MLKTIKELISINSYSEDENEEIINYLVNQLDHIQKK